MAALGDWQESRYFDVKDRAVLAFTDSLARDNKVSDALYADLKTHFTETEIVKLSFTVSLAGMVNRMHAVFKTDVDEATLDGALDTPFCPLPVRAGG